MYLSVSLCFTEVLNSLDFFTAIDWATKFTGSLSMTSFCEKKCVKWRTELESFSLVRRHHTCIANKAIAVRDIPSLPRKCRVSGGTHARSGFTVPGSTVPYRTILYWLVHVFLNIFRIKQLFLNIIIILGYYNIFSLKLNSFFYFGNTTLL